MRLATTDAEHTRDHFALNPWRPGEQRYSFHLTLEASPGLAEASHSLHRAAAGLDGLRPVPARWLHLTMTGLGTVGEVDRQAVLAAGEAVFQEWGRFAGEVVRYDQVFVADESVMFTARDDEWLHELAAVQRAAVEQVLGPQRWCRLWPHSSSLYTTDEVPVGILREHLAGAVSALPELVRAQPTLTLMELARDTGDYRWRVLRSSGPRP